MARLRRETDVKTLALSRYSLLMAKRTEIEEEMKGIEVYLRAVGEIRTQRRDKRKKVEQAAPQAPTKAAQQAKPKAVARKTRTIKPQKKVSATDSILSAIGKAVKGISIDQIMKQTGLMRNTVNGVLNRMKKEGKVKAASRGVYVKQNSAGQKNKAESAAKPPAVPQKASKPKAKAPVKRPSRAKKVSAANHRTIV